MIDLNKIKYILTIDLEMTCDNHPHFTRQDQEIIEIGWLLQDLNYNIIKQNNFFVKPLINPKITDYCTNLTGIVQEDVQNCFPLRIELARWLSELPNSDSLILAAWGADPILLQTELTDQETEYPFYEEFINIKLVDNFNCKTRRSLKTAIEDLGLILEKPHHRALPDAITASKILQHYKMGVMDYQVSNNGTYKQLVTRKQKETIGKFVKNRIIK